ncbi:similar to Saccharomyces cerevisiae YOR297C TIM18 Component of the mitochondrial TIM22 complex involved in insertion of polytopic proteins into the inner membrane [Maudiozyma barnettii]|uniref:Succinate dehydrogenase [ubiquinone] cytochrome b small subunit n=1 Tax=Maudiozyma barnettii TaxID=61262 RepID=A0A8H2VCS7_9SACH|nr:Tim18p [Kazachstania barnettii]CAB4252930.1 similar to Saccharomyces cerevisiae YOR297C TIM18 Component of the mitochondrial TIM22 complex involved in insertion of polytopic proteins into the inner membrane [Kazachstania barnettii]CAD1780725.1 similar to Saccharomyces cerevisiae YOR297C TIM18 Component of the mitochondrial TIM22 complex involved in insertion of polytopic proteins into the inner membrane [Kazachstania barnettii]
MLSRMHLGLHVSRSFLQTSINRGKAVNLISNYTRFQSTQTIKKDDKLINKNDSIKGLGATVTAETKIVSKKEIPKKIIRPGYFETPKDPGLNGKFQEDYQRIMKYTLIPLTLTPFFTSYAGIPFHPMLDATLGSVFLLYAHYGFSSLIYQYLPKEKYPRWSTISLWTLYSSSCLAFYGLYELETENNGIVDLINKLWNFDDRNVFVFSTS